MNDEESLSTIEENEEEDYGINYNIKSKGSKERKNSENEERV